MGPQKKGPDLFLLWRVVVLESCAGVTESCHQATVSKSTTGSSGLLPEDALFNSITGPPLGRSITAGVRNAKGTEIG